MARQAPEGAAVTLLGILTMTAVCGFVWGGFVVLLVRAIRAESGARRE